MVALTMRLYHNRGIRILSCTNLHIIFLKESRSEQRRRHRFHSSTIEQQLKKIYILLTFANSTVEKCIKYYNKSILTWSAKDPHGPVNLWYRVILWKKESDYHDEVVLNLIICYNHTLRSFSVNKDGLFWAGGISLKENILKF